MLTFQQLSLDDIAPVNIKEIVIGDPIVEAVLTDKAVSDGMSFGSKKYSRREIDVYFYFRYEDMLMKAEWLEKIYAWAHSDQPAELRVPERPSKYIYAHCSQLPQFSAIQAKKEMRLTFTCADPFFYDDEQRAAACGTSFQIDSVFGVTDDMKKTKERAYIEWENPSSAASPAWVLDGGAKTIALSGGVAAGTVIVTLDPIAVTLDGASIMNQLTRSSRAFVLTHGSHTIAGNGTLKYRERCL